MEHLDAELLSLMALGETAGTDADADHLANCQECAETLRGLQLVRDIATLEPAGIKLEQPGPQTWAAIHQALGLSPALAPDPLTRPESPGIRLAAVETPPQPGNEPDAAPPFLRPATRDRRRPRPGLWLAAAAGILLGTAAGWTAAGITGQPGTPVPGPTSIVLAQTPLTPLPAHTGSGEAQVRQLPDGTRQLTIRLSADKTTGYQQVWVGTSDLTGMVSLGVLADGTGTFTIPAGIDLAQYPIVDISDQAYNGNPAHSDDSVARGRLNSKT
ncbi:anti-sigma factor [Arthrobacter liuii]|uniref:Anti-sigma-K factor rskA n=1 Tax=Arthrobacter liuii TaxID=1476996 RepID=A0ABQ2AJ34_9MICC|nr:anti-sigma factor [Arthrobacter liuii]GGH91113.1 hypothetical protein GCM10007170_06500 [Arthrobacter liuii]